MATKTTNYGFTKDDPNEYYDIAKVNSNLDKIDSELKKVDDKAAANVSHSLATAANDFLVASTAGQFVKRTPAEIKSILSLGSAAYNDSAIFATAAQGTKADNAIPSSEKGVAGGVALYDTFNAHLSDYVHQIGYGVDIGAENAYVVTLNPVPTAYVEGMCVAVKIANTNTAASTLNVNGLGAKAIKKANGNDVTSGNLKVGSIYTVRYNGTNFILQGEGGGSGTAQPDDVDLRYTFTNEDGEHQGIAKVPDLITIANAAIAGNNSIKSNVIAALTHMGLDMAAITAWPDIVTKINGVVNMGDRTFPCSDTAYAAPAGYYKSITLPAIPSSDWKKFKSGYTEVIAGSAGGTSGVQIDIGFIPTLIIAASTNNNYPAFSCWLHAPLFPYNYIFNSNVSNIYIEIRPNSMVSNQTFCIRYVDAGGSSQSFFWFAIR